MPNSDYSNIFTQTPGPNTTWRLRNGDTDGKYWVKGTASSANIWRGPYADAPTARTAAIAFLDSLYLPSIPYTAISECAYGKRYWIVNSNLTRRGRWLLLPEETFNEVDPGPPDDQDQQGTYPPVSSVIAGRVTTLAGQPQRWEQVDLNNAITAYGGNIYQNGTAIDPSQYDANRLAWKPAGISYDAQENPVITEGWGTFTTAQTLTGANVNQGPAQVSKPHNPRAYLPYIDLLIQRPATDLLDDDGGDGLFLAGWTAEYASIIRTAECASQNTPAPVPDPAARFGDASATSPYDTPIVPHRIRVLTTANLSGMMVAPLGSRPYFSFDGPETVNLFPGTQVGSVLDPSTPLDWQPAYATLNDYPYAFPDYPEPPSGTDNNVIWNSTSLIETTLNVRAVYVSRTLGVATLIPSVPLSVGLAIMPITCESLPWALSSLACDLPTLPSTPGAGGNIGQYTRAGFEQAGEFPTNYQPNLYGGSDTDYSGIMDLPGDFRAQTVYFGEQNVGGAFPTNTQGPIPNVNADGSPFTFLPPAPLTPDKFLVQTTYNTVANQQGYALLGSMQGRVWRLQPAFTDGGTIGRRTPSLYGPLGVMAGQFQVNNVNGGVGDGSPELGYGPTPPAPVYRYYPGYVYLWIVDKADTKKYGDPPVDNGSEQFRFTLDDGRTAYWNVGDQTNAPSLPGFACVGFGGARPGDAISGEAGVAYDEPFYARGPYRYYISSDQNEVPTDGYNSNHNLVIGPVLDATGLVGSFTAILPGTASDGLPNYVQVFVYSAPQKKPILG